MEASPPVIVSLPRARQAARPNQRSISGGTILLSSGSATRDKFHESISRVFHKLGSKNKQATLSRILGAYDTVKQAFDALKDPEGKPKRRRTGEALYLHSAGVSMMLAEEFNEKDPELFIEALYHDFGEDIRWEQAAIGTSHLRNILRSKVGRLMLPGVARYERRRMEFLLQQEDHLSHDNARVVSALSIDKNMSKAFPGRNLYYDQIKHLPDELQSRAAKIRIADKIYNLRSGESDLSDPEQWKRLAKQLQAAIEFTLPIADLIEGNKQRLYRSRLEEAIGYVLIRLEQHQRFSIHHRPAIKKLWSLFAEKAGVKSGGDLHQLQNRIREEVGTTFASVLQADYAKLNPSSLPPPPTA